jgi:hypothetical protein
LERSALLLQGREDFAATAERCDEKAYASLVQPVEQKWNREREATRIGGVEPTNVAPASNHYRSR